MLTAFWSGLGGDLAKRWTARVLTPAFAFWLGGLAAVWWRAHERGVRTSGWVSQLTATARSVDELPDLAKGLLVLSFLLVVTASALAAETMTLPVLRLLEGYGWRPAWLRSEFIAYRRWRRRRWADRVEALAVRQRLGTLTLEEFLELCQLETTPKTDPSRLRALRQQRNEGFDARMAADLGRGRTFLHHCPNQDGMGMPTRLGDILRAAEGRPADKYGLDAIVCWYSLWLLLPSDARAELIQTRAAVDGAARTWIWGAGIIIWTPWTWWALPIAAATSALAYYRGMLPAAAVFGELIGSTFDLYRFRLYDALHLPRPSTPRAERRRNGPQVTNILWGGPDEPDLGYLPGPDIGAADG
jgi:hypothetical protein